MPGISSKTIPIEQVKPDYDTEINEEVTNVTASDFTYGYCGRQYTIAAGETVSRNQPHAQHAALHLAKEILNAEARQEEHQLRTDLGEQYFTKVKAAQGVPKAKRAALIELILGKNDPVPKPYICPVCNAGFDVRIALAGHMKSHKAPAEEG